VLAVEAAVAGARASGCFRDHISFSEYSLAAEAKVVV